MTELTCSGEWDDYGKERLSADYCIPSKIGNCQSYCPIKCTEGQILCPGKMDRQTGCYGPDFCHHGSKYLSLMFATLLWIFPLLTS